MPTSRATQWTGAEVPTATDPHTTEITQAAAAVTDLATQHHLALRRLVIDPHDAPSAVVGDQRHQWTPTLPRIEVTVTYLPREFLRWCDVLGAEKATVIHRGDQTILVATVRREDFTWRVIGAVRPRLNHPAVALPRRPGRRSTDSDSKDVAVQSLRTALTAATPAGAA